MDYLIGDLQGCCDPFETLLATVDFSPSRDRVHLLGDLVNRGPASLRVLERLCALGDAAQCVLGNHDLHLLAVADGVRRVRPGDTLDGILEHPQRERWLDWLRHRPLAARACGWLMVHAGLVPQWSTAQALELAGEIETLLRGPGRTEFFPLMYGNSPSTWRDDLAGPERWRFVVNTLTRIRFCNAEGELDLQTKDSADAAPRGFRPWFEHGDRASVGEPIAFGHWSTLGLLERPDLLGIDTGCVWGGALTAVRVDGGRREIFQVHCPQSQRPGQTNGHAA